MELKEIRGIGAKTEEKLNELGIFTPVQLANYLPSHYLDLSKESDISEAVEGNYILVAARVVKVSGIVTAKKNLKFFRARCESSGQSVSMVWFNQPYMKSKLEEGEEHLFWGKITLDAYGRYEMVNPNFERRDGVRKLNGIVPIYRNRNLIPQSNLRAMIKDCLEKLDVVSLLDGECEKSFKLVPLKKAYYYAHFPDELKEAKFGQDRIAVEDVVEKMLAYKVAKDALYADKSYKYNLDPRVAERVVDALPFKLTPSQSAAVDDIIADLNGRGVMNRILLGDVGSGKTAVALVTIYYAVRCGYQCAMMAPTEILSRQHYGKARELFEPLGLNVELLNSSTGRQERARILESLANGAADVVIGTHSLLNGDVVFANLGYAVIDELHKFGVRQKGRLEDKTRYVDTLVMSATPIPRSVALIYYGDLDVTRLENRRDTGSIRTYVLHDDKLGGMYARIRDNAQRGRQAYIVCPLVEDDEGCTVYSAKKLYDELRASELAGLKVGLIYGKMKEEAKSKVMRDFHDRKTDVLVATTVIEVGIDVPNANIMLIMNAERYGLAALHQLRGRIGRDGGAAECYLHTGSAVTDERLALMKRCSDGYEIAEYDLDARGCGDYLGVNQSGGNKFTFAVNKKVIALGKSVLEHLTARKSRDELVNDNVKAYVYALTNITVN